MIIISLIVLFFISCDKDTETKKPKKQPVSKTEAEPVKISSASEVKIGVIQLSETDDFENLLKESITKESQKYGAQVLFCFNDADPDKNGECVEKLILNEGVHVLIVDAPTVESFNKVVEIAKTKGTYIINTGTQKSIQRQPLVVQYMGKDNTEGGYKIGTTTGQLIDTYLDGKAKVIILDMSKRVKYKDRASSFRHGLRQYAFEAKVIATVEGSESVEEAQKIVADLLKQYPEVDVIYSVCKEATLGAAKACEAAGKDPAKFVITGYDATEEIFNSIKADGFIKAVVLDQPNELARIMMLAATDLVTAKRELKEYQLQPHWVLTALIQKDNVDKWME
jgi:ABC-type sugar transport system substrate-binding protein